MMRKWSHGHTAAGSFLLGGIAFTGRGWLLALVCIAIGALGAVAARMGRNGVRRTAALADAATARLSADTGMLAGWAPCAQCGAPHVRRSPFCSSACRRYFRLHADGDAIDDKVPF